MTDVVTLRVLMYREDDGLSAVCLEPYLVVRGSDELQVRERIAALFDRYLQTSLDDVRALGSAPANYFKDWVETSGNPRAMKLDVPTAHKKVKVKLKEYHRSAFFLDSILA